MILTLYLSDLVAILSLIVTVIGVIRSNSSQNTPPSIHMTIMY